MRSYYSLLLFGGLFCLQFWAVATALELDNISDYLKDVKGGILVKDGKRTSCELGVIDNQSAVVSPICMGFTTTNRTQPGVNFEVYLDAGIDGKTAKYTVENITIHPGLNSSGLNNDIAVIKYNMAGANEWQNLEYSYDPNFTVRYPFHPDDPRLTIFDGDFYKDQKDPIVFPITESSSESPVESSTESLADSTASSGLSRGAKIAVGVCVSIGGLLIIVAAATYMFLRRKRQKARVVDTLRQQEIQEALVPNGGDAIVPAGIIAQSNEDDAQSAIEEPLPAYKPTDNDALRGSSDSSSQSRDMSL
ncbi:hypothetical protein IWW55_000252 [Coemansia sp. RSA 2706]|nr:hypothetical protein IWW55_000252 [Coemansia sp. RSA 2706]